MHHQLTETPGSSPCPDLYQDASKTNPTAQNEKDSPQTSQQSVHPGVPKSERSTPKSKLHQENVVTSGRNAFLIFDQKFHPMSKQPTRLTAWASVETLCFEESTFSNKNPFPVKTLH